MRKTISSLVQDFQVIFVASVGRDTQSGYADNYPWQPANIWTAESFPGPTAVTNSPSPPREVANAKTAWTICNMSEATDWPAAITFWPGSVFPNPLPGLADYWLLNRENNSSNDDCLPAKKSLTGGMGAEKSVCGMEWIPTVQYNTSHVYDRWTGIVGLELKEGAKFSFFRGFFGCLIVPCPVICIIPHSTVTWSYRILFFLFFGFFLGYLTIPCPCNMYHSTATWS